MTGPAFDIAVIGAGLTGAAAAWAASRRGLSVAVFEQFDVANPHGSSHGSARIFRRAYADPFYVELTGRAGALWQQLQSEAGAQLLSITGGLDFGAKRDPAAIAARLAEAGVAHELLELGEAQHRWPGIRFDGPVLHHPEAGVVDADEVVRSFVRLSRERGAQVSENTEVTAIEPAPDRVVLQTSAGPVTAATVIVAAGAWIAELLAGLVVLPPLRITQQQIFHFPQRDKSTFWPVFVCKDELSLYGLPGGRDGGGNGIKLAEHDGGLPTTARTRSGVVDSVARERLSAHVAQWFPGLEPEPYNETTCLYTSTPDEDFVLDRTGRLVVCSPCSGHGAKFAPLIGELAVGIALDEEHRPARFRLGR